MVGAEFSRLVTEVAEIQPSSNDPRKVTAEDRLYEEPGVSASLRDGDHIIPPTESPRQAEERAAAVIGLLKKHIKVGPAESVRDELRKVQDFCRIEGQKLIPIIELEPEATKPPELF